MPFQIVRNDITKMAVDAIVNTANPYPGYGDGTDTAVYQGAGRDRLLKDRQAIGIMERGTSAVTPGYKLPAKYIIHTVGCCWQGGNSGEENIVRKCYQSSFSIAKEQKLESIAFPLLSSGSYGFPKGIALRIALSEISDFLKENDMMVYLVVFDEESFELSGELFGGIDSYISQNYVEQKEASEYQTHLHMFGAITDEASSNKNRCFERRIFTPGKTSEGFTEKNDELSVQSLIEAPTAQKKRSLEDCINNLDKTFMELVFSFADDKGFSDVEVQRKANLDKKTFSKLKCGNSKNPSKPTALALAIGLELNIDDAKDLLSRAGYALSPCSKRDLIVQYFIEAEVYDIGAINVALFEHGEQLLGSVAKE